MKVTTELKNLIKAEFEKKKEDYRKESKKQGKIQYEAELEKFKQTEVYQNYIKSVRELQDYLKVCEKTYGRYGEYDSFRLPYYYDNSDYFRKAEDMIKAYYNYNSNNNDMDFNSQRDKLLIKLTYEKDFDKVQALLKEYGIEL